MSGSWFVFRRWLPWPTRTSTRSCGCGPVWVTTVRAQFARGRSTDRSRTFGDCAGRRRHVDKLARHRPIHCGSDRLVRLRPPRSIVEANTQRVYARLMALREPLDSTAARRAIWSFAERAVPSKSPGAFNKALMDFGATICVPTSPRCDECPLTACCQAFRDGQQGEIPLDRAGPEPTAVRQAMVAVRRGRRYLLRRSPAGERWAGLWEFLACRWTAMTRCHSRIWNGPLPNCAVCPSRQKPRIRVASHGDAISDSAALRYGPLSQRRHAGARRIPLGSGRGIRRLRLLDAGAEVCRPPGYEWTVTRTRPHCTGGAGGGTTVAGGES